MSLRTPASDDTLPYERFPQTVTRPGGGRIDTSRLDEIRRRRAAGETLESIGLEFNVWPAAVWHFLKRHDEPRARPARRGRAPGDLLQRFESKISPCPITGCWWWTGTPRGRRQKYGQFGINSGKNVGAHRFSYELYVGPIPDGLDVLHRCDQPACVNPAHLWVGTHADNMADMVSKGRSGKRKNSVPETALLAIRTALGVGSNADAAKAVLGLIEFKHVALARMDLSPEPRVPPALGRLVFSLGPA